MANGVEKILRLFVKPGEPLYIPQDDSNVVVEVPIEYLPEKYKSIAITNGLIPRKIPKEGTIKVKVHENFDKLRKILAYPMELNRKVLFSVFIPAHMAMAGRIIDVFMGESNLEDLLSIAVYCRENVNPSMFIYALSITILHRPDMKNVRIPSMVAVFPINFVNKEAIVQAREEAVFVIEEERRSITIERDHTATDLDVEHRVAYFREDLGINLHHYYWHLVYPTEAGKDMKIVKKDRRGELFYYFHQQMMARYNFERFSNSLGRTESLVDWRLPIAQGYYSKLGADSGTGYWPGRPSDVAMKNVSRKLRKFTLIDCERMADRISEAIHQGYIITKDGKRVELNNPEGIDILGNIVEASELSPNPTLYGNLHNNLHIALASCIDPDYRHLEGLGVMGHASTAMRDPVFYRLHTSIDNIFQQHKSLQSPYTKEELEFKGVQITDVQVIPNEGDNNLFYTFWREADVELANGLSFQLSTGSIRVRFTHLDYRRFSYKINVNNVSGTTKTGTVRIFMAPKYDESRLKFPYDQQRHMMIEMDKFTVELPTGSNVITRQSSQSSVIIPYEQTFPNLDGIKDSTPIPPEDLNYCGCGWPEHMLLPKGTEPGLPVYLFVMISDYEKDEVKLGNAKKCYKTAASFCGLKDEKYPDARAMGYPFDRVPVAGVQFLEQFLTDNMRVTEMKIISSDYTVKIDDPPSISVE